MADVIEGKVAKILDESTLIINVGSTHGVQPKMTFIVYMPGDDVMDPDSGESLGHWEVVKGQIVAAHVQEKITICTAGLPEESEQGDPSTHTLSAAMIADHMRTGGSQHGLNVNRSQIEGMPQIGPISVGDPVRSVQA